jgi:transcriptional regulator with PAS, ATPase and Fis domain
VAHHRFRQDLYFRLNIVRISVPPLRVRTGDIPLLVEHFIAKFNALQGRRISGISEGAVAQLLAYDYPGNVRELENAIEHAFVVCGGSVIQIEDLPPHIRGDAVGGGAARTAVSRQGPLQEAEAITIRETLQQHGGNRSATARDLGVSRNTLWRKMRRYGIE